MEAAPRFDDTPNDIVPFGTSFVQSEAFQTLFREGMHLVEITAGYLDGTGREEAKRLGRHGALAYASESMRLTTRLMQVASWLLVQRAVAEGEISAAQAQREKSRVRLSDQPSAVSEADFEDLPEILKELVRASTRFHARVIHLDGVLAQLPPDYAPKISPIAFQHDQIRLAFARG